MRIFMVAGEASGDAYAQALAISLRRQAPAVRIEGVGGPLFLATADAVVANSAEWGSISIVHGFKVGARVLVGFLRIKSALRTGKPGVFVPIDFGFVNVKLARYARSRGWKVVYVIPPGSWKRHAAGADMATVPHAVVTPFPWSAELINRAGGNAHWFGHLLWDLTPDIAEEDRRGVAILPGSRAHELKHNLPAIAGAMNELTDPAEFAVAPNVDLAMLKAQWKVLAPGRTEDRFTVGDASGVLARAERAIVCSGTATLQAALAQTPMVVIYRFSKLMEAEGKLLGLHRKIRFISLPNILADREIVPELIQDKASPAAIRSALEALAPGSTGNAAQREGFAEMKSVLGGRGAIEATARLILEVRSQVD